MRTDKQKAKKRKIIYTLALITLVVVVGLFGWFLTVIFEGEKPFVHLEPLPEFLTGSQKFTLQTGDEKMGLKRVRVYVSQEGREVTVFEKKFPFVGLFNRRGVRQFDQEIVVDPSKLNMAQGRVDLNVRVWDYSRRGGGDGNTSWFYHKMIVDTIPPSIRPISRMHNISVGGSCLVVYQASSDTQESGVFVDNYFFPGFPAGGNSQTGMHVCYFALPYDSSPSPMIYLWAKDKAGNLQKVPFYHHVRERSFHHERINVTDKFLNRILPYFSFYLGNSEGSDAEKFLKINRDLRKQSHELFMKLREKTSPERLWEGPWVRLKNAAPMASFGDQRSYYYQGEKIDEETHLGNDLASLANAPVQAANDGRVLFSNANGIYGLCVVLDHGQGLASVYGHLSKIEVTPNQVVKKGDVIGYTGQTGLAGGDHLHFAVMVNGVFVNPEEWWDSHWIEDNIDRKLALLGQ